MLALGGAPAEGTDAGPQGPGTAGTAELAAPAPADPVPLPAALVGIFDDPFFFFSIARAPAGRSAARTATAA